MRLRFSIRNLLWLLLVVALAVVAFLWARPLRHVPVIDASTAIELGAFADELWQSRVGQDWVYVPESAWPTAIAKLAPKSVRANSHGVFIKLGEFFVEEWGLFLLPTDSSFNPTQDGDPSYCPLQGRVYWYEIKG